MMTNLSLTKVQPSWSVERMRQETGELIGLYKVSIWTELKDHPEILNKVRDAFFANFEGRPEVKGIKTPLDLVTYLAELAVNLVGATVSISGDEKEATIVYDELPNRDMIHKTLHVTPELQEEMAKQFQNTIQKFSARFGFKCEAEVKFDHPIAKITFIKN